MTKEATKPKKVRQKKKTYPLWSDSVDRLLLYADIMGFKSRVLSLSHNQLKDRLINFRNDWQTKMSPLKIKDYLRFVQFSDSILIVVNGTDEKMFNLLTKASVCLMHTALEHGFPIKGVISQGKFLFDKDSELYFGRPLVDAALLHDELKYYGVAVHHSAEHIVKLYQSDSNPYSNTPISLDSGETSHFHLAWNLLDTSYHSENITEKCFKWLENIEESVSGRPRIYVDKTRKILLNDSKIFKDEDKLSEG